MSRLPSIVSASFRTLTPLAAAGLLCWHVVAQDPQPAGPVKGIVHRVLSRKDGTQLAEIRASEVVPEGDGRLRLVSPTAWVLVPSKENPALKAVFRSPGGWYVPKEETLSLRGDVRVERGTEFARCEAVRVRILDKRLEIESSAPFELGRGTLTLRARGLQADLNAGEYLIGGDIHLTDSRSGTTLESAGSGLVLSQAKEFSIRLHQAIEIAHKDPRGVFEGHADRGFLRARVENDEPVPEEVLLEGNASIVESGGALRAERILWRADAEQLEAVDASASFQGARLESARLTYHRAAKRVEVRQGVRGVFGTDPKTELRCRSMDISLAEKDGGVSVSSLLAEGNVRARRGEIEMECDTLRTEPAGGRTHLAGRPFQMRAEGVHVVGEMAKIAGEEAVISGSKELTLEDRGAAVRARCKGEARVGPAGVRLEEDVRLATSEGRMHCGRLFILRKGDATEMRADRGVELVLVKDGETTRITAAEAHRSAGESSFRLTGRPLVHVVSPTATIKAERIEIDPASRSFSASGTNLAVEIESQ